MASALVLLKHKRNVGNVLTKVYKCTLSANYTNSGAVGNTGTPGETLNFDAATNPNFIARPKLPRGPAAKLPSNQEVRVFLPNGYDGQIEQNAVAPTPANFVLRIFASGGNEVAGGAYPTGLLQSFLIEVDVPLKYA